MVNNKELITYFLSYGLGGGFGHETSLFEAYSLDDAEKEAYYKSLEEYEGFEGCHGIRTVEEVEEEDGVDSDEAQDIYRQEKEDWLDYNAEIYNPELHDDLLY